MEGGREREREGGVRKGLAKGRKGLEQIERGVTRNHNKRVSLH
jgi:hypothetical protein